ncbi:MAG: hypothetical protein NWT02_04025 [Opitutales bacterium]|jgi:hypothetical protein|nr:hypothetical protein [Opitutales bacterium]MDP4643595.1 hypothetical protein [Opitutales bacterium]MDP4693022.1 hypothetical protein [Opitutales bacterium]MDP4778323.1 hypothetical protein [Opitutales bacterium]MDP4884608.1 hypothetical protein [Opitutales bacterium]
MNKVYDKLVLALAVLALLAGVGLYVVKSGAVPPGKPTISVETTGDAYSVVPVPTSTDVTAAWPMPVEQSRGAGWTYDVFTPPKVFIGENGELTPIGWVVGPPKPPFGVYLADFTTNKPYRIQIEGYVEEDRDDPTKVLILLFDEELDQRIRTRIGREVAKSEFKVIDFNVERIRDGAGNIQKVATVKIQDLRTNEEITLKHGERLLVEAIDITIASKEDSSVRILLNKEGQTFETPQGQYTLEQINLEELTVTVKKQGDEERDAETKVLSVLTSKPASKTISNPVTPAVEASFDDGSFSIDF